MQPSFGDDVLSFRSALNLGVTEFAGFLETGDQGVEWLSELVVVLSNYQEEGLQLFPVVFISHHLNLILEKLDGKDPIQVGSGPISASTIRTAFKTCAPLAEDRQWALFVEFNETNLNYGVFRPEQSPLKSTAFEKLRQLKDSTAKLIGMTRIGGNFVEVRAASERHKYIDVSGALPESYSPPQLIHEFSQLISKSVSPQVRPMLRAFYYQLGVDLLHSTHGTLIGIVPDSQVLPKVLSDGIFLEPKIRVIDGISAYLSSNSMDSLQRLKSWSQLLRKMTGMDGITVLDTSGSIVGYHCFIQNSAIDSKSRISWGGARRRAFEVLCSYLGQGLEGVLYRSQDGAADFRSFQSKS
jgi:hypothetical protein